MFSLLPEILKNNLEERQISTAFEKYLSNNNSDESLLILRESLYLIFFFFFQPQRQSKYEASY